MVRHQGRGVFLKLLSWTFRLASDPFVPLLNVKIWSNSVLKGQSFQLIYSCDCCLHPWLTARVRPSLPPTSWGERLWKRQMFEDKNNNRSHWVLNIFIKSHLHDLVYFWSLFIFRLDIPWPCLRQMSLIFLPCFRQNSDLRPCLRQKSQKTYPGWPHVPAKLQSTMNVHARIHSYSCKISKRLTVNSNSWN